MQKRNICVVITDKAQLSRLLTLLKELKGSKRFNLQIVVGGGALTYRYGNIVGELVKGGFKPDFEIPTAIEGGEHLGMAKTAALGMLEFATALKNLDAEYVVVRGDRFEVLPIAAAAAYLNKKVIHLEGGDRSGSIDESVRHAITKLAHVHFVTNKEAKQRVIKMGEKKEMVFNVGSLDVDYLSKHKMLKKVPNSIVNSHGTGARLNLGEPYIVVTQNPVTSEADRARWQVEQTLQAVHKLAVQSVWIWPNLDAGSDAIAKRIREWQVRNAGQRNIRFIRYLAPAKFLNVVNKAAAVVGNSSLGIKECAWLGVPAVNIGSRQAGRLMAANVVNVPYDKHRIRAAINKQIKQGRYKQSKIFGDGNTAKSIVKILGLLEIGRQKKITY